MFHVVIIKLINVLLFFQLPKIINKKEKNDTNHNNKNL